MKLHEDNCKKARKLICKTCSKKLDHWHKLNEHETKCKKKYNETKITYKCSICSKVLDNKSNLLQHEKACKKHCEAVKGRKKQKKDHHKSTLMKQLQSKYDTILNEENIITQKLKQTKSKITDRQHHILKLEKQMHACKRKNESYGNYLKLQITDLQDQICKYESLIKELSNKKMELNSQKTAIAHTLQLFRNELPTDESDIPVTRTLPTTNMTRNQQTAQNPRKRLASDVIEQTSDLSGKDTDVNMDIPAKKPRYSNSTDDDDIPVERQLPNTHITRNKETTQNPRKRLASDSTRQTSESSECETDLDVDIPAKTPRYSDYKTDEFDSNDHEKLKKLQKKQYMREYIKQKRMSTEYTRMENLKHREYMTQKRLSTEFRQQENPKGAEKTFIY